MADKNTLEIILSARTEDFTSALKSSAQNVDSFRQRIKDLGDDVKRMGLMTQSTFAQKTLSMFDVRPVAEIRSEMSRLTQSYVELKRSGVASATDLSRALDSLRAKNKELYASIGSQSKLSSARSLLGVSSSAEIAAQSAKIKSAFATIKNSGVSSMADISRASGAMKTKLQEISGEQSKMDSFFNTMKNLNAGITGVIAKTGALLGGVSVVAFGKSIFDAGVQMDQLNKSFNTITGSSDLAKQELDFVREAADKLGLDFAETATAYKGLTAASKGTKLEGKATRDIFMAVSEASTALGLSAEDTSGSLLAISQMMSKGKVSAEELRQQLGERLPGTFQLAAKAMNMTTQEFDKLMSSGGIMAEDFLPKLAAEMHKAFEKGAMDGANGPVAALNRFKNSWFDLRVEIGKAGFMDMATGKIKDLTAAMNDPEIRKKITDLANMFFSLSESVLNFAVNHGKAIAGVAGGLWVLSAFVGTCKLLRDAWLGLKMAMSLEIGGKLISNLADIKLSLVAASEAAGTFQKSLAGTLAFSGGFAIGKEISDHYFMAQARKDLNDLMFEIEKTKAKYSEFANFSPQGKTSLWDKNSEELGKYKKELEGAYRYQVAVVQDLYAASKEKSFFGDMTGDARKASVELVSAREKLKRLEEGMDEYRGVVEENSKNAAGAMTSSARTMEKVTGEALKEMQKKYQEYAKEVQRLNDDISSRSRNLYAELRSLARTGMTGSSAWADQKKEAEQYMAAAKKAAQEAQTAMSAGDQITAVQKWKEAVQYADDAKSSYKDLNKEVKDGETVVVSQQQAMRAAFDGVKQAGELAIGIQKQQKDAFKDAMKGLESKASFDELTKEMDASEKTWLKSWENMSSYTMDQIQKIDVALDAVANKKRTAKLVIDYEDGSRNVYKTGDGMGFQGGGLLQLAAGGSVRNALAGGRLPGFGGGDRRLLLGEDGEVMLRKEAVKAGGLRAALAFNAGRWDVVLEELHNKVKNSIGYHLGGVVGSLPALPVQRLASGGEVSGGSDFGTVNLSFPSGTTVPVRTDKETARAMLREFERMGWRASS